MADYNPVGAMGGLFAPAFIHGDPQSEAATQAWMAKNWSMTNPMVEQTRQPVSFNTGNPAGMVDPEALRVLSQGGPYDMNARRAAIAAQVQAQQQAAQQQAAQQQLPTTVPMQGGGTMPIYGRAGGTDAYLSSPEGQYFTNEMNQIAANGPPKIAPPTYSDSYGGGG